MASGPGLREWVLCLRFPVGTGGLRFPFFHSQGLHLTVPLKGPQAGLSELHVLGSGLQDAVTVQSAQGTSPVNSPCYPA